MRLLFLPEIMDCSYLPNTLRMVVREILELMLDKPFRKYKHEVVEQIVGYIGTHKINQVLEIGAGAAPLSRKLAARMVGSKDIILSPSDKLPDRDNWKLLENAYPDNVMPIYEPMDLTTMSLTNSNSLLVISSCFHHIHPKDRKSVIQNIANHNVLICEPINRNLISLGMVLFAFIPALLTPLILINRRGTSRRLVWCWFIPLAPLIIVWDGIASCLRCWTRQEWVENLEAISSDKEITLRSDSVSMSIGWLNSRT